MCSDSGRGWVTILICFACLERQKNCCGCRKMFADILVSDHHPPPSIEEKLLSHDTMAKQNLLANEILSIDFYFPQTAVRLITIVVMKMTLPFSSTLSFVSSQHLQGCSSCLPPFSSNPDTNDDLTSFLSILCDFPRCHLRRRFNSIKQVKRTRMSESGTGKQPVETRCA